MPNSNYLRGVRFERKLKKQWEAEGYLGIRSAGSHSFADLVLVDPKNADVPTIFVQCKIVQTVADMDRLHRQFRAKPPIPKHEHYLLCFAVYIRKTRSLEFAWL
jgi:Holliday junction resolvase